MIITYFFCPQCIVYDLIRVVCGRKVITTILSYVVLFYYALDFFASTGRYLSIYWNTTVLRTWYLVHYSAVTPHHALLVPSW